MVSKRLMLTWAFFDTCLLAAGLVTLVLSFVWRQPNLLLNLTFGSFDLTGGTVLGIIFLATFVSSLLLVAMRGRWPLVMLNWLLLVNGISILIAGTYIWFYTLHERNNYHNVFGMQSNATKIAVQDTLMCCGYFDATDEVAFGGTFCPNAAAAMAANSFCVTPITKFADMMLNDVFTTIYGFMAIVIGLFLANMCVIKRRQEEKRFERIDAKRGGHGFV
ncbi:hypothetical protein JVT61DRAFT_11692 [Boletus reticuloceps]|uniref:Tetraspanin n=1 Tax=Boletus reticuloceps TaxID=495285 RepID=A0A8I2YYC4_9AGAM|nr:hypothetical protein JVT61DRAFT_11692 [Boletus reticuloceps]